jgi:hypothetical protein
VRGAAAAPDSGKGNRKPPLTPQQVAALEALPGWRWEEWVEVWEERRQQLAAFVQQHSRLPRQVGSKSRPLLEGEKDLGYWLRTQRVQLRGQRRLSLAVSRRAGGDGCHRPGMARVVHAYQRVRASGNCFCKVSAACISRCTKPTVVCNNFTLFVLHRGRGKQRGFIANDILLVSLVVCLAALCAVCLYSMCTLIVDWCAFNRASL